MGVRGLTTFVENNDRKFYEISRLHDCPLVIDGSGLSVYLSSFSSFPVVIGNEYLSYSVAITKFFQKLKSCKIEPIMLFDGPSPSEKQETIAGRLENALTAVHDMVHSNDPQKTTRRLISRFDMDTLLQVLSDLNVPYAYSLVDADVEIVALANLLDCPVLGEDSDFFIFNIKGGYIPFEELDLQGTYRHGEVECFRCRKYRTINMLRSFGVKEAFLPFLAIVLGCDWLRRGPFEDFLHEISGIFRIDRRNHMWRVITSLRWLKSAPRDETFLLRELKDHLSTENREKVLQKLEYTMSFYKTVPDVTETMKVLDRTKCAIFNTYPKMYDEKLLWNIDEAVRNGFVSDLLYTLIKDKSVPLSVSTFGDGTKSPFDCSTELRCVAYKMIYRRFCLDKCGPEDMTIGEYDIEGESYQIARKVNISSRFCLQCEEQHPFKESCKNSDVIKITSASLISKLLGFRFEQSFSKICKLEFHNHLAVWGSETYPVSKYMDENFCKRIDAVMLGTFYWFHKTTPNVIISCSLLFNILISIMKFTKVKHFLSGADEKSGKNKRTVNEKLDLSKNNDSSEQQKLLGSPWYMDKTESKHSPGQNESLELSEKNQTKDDEKFMKQYAVSELLGPADIDIDNLDGTEDSEFLQTAAEWKAVIFAIKILREAVEYDGLKIGMQDVFASCLKFVQIHQRLKNLFVENPGVHFESACTIIIRRLEPLPSYKKMFGVLVDFISQKP